MESMWGTNNVKVKQDNKILGWCKDNIIGEDIKKTGLKFSNRMFIVNEDEFCFIRIQLQLVFLYFQLVFKTACVEGVINL